MENQLLNHFAMDLTRAQNLSLCNLNGRKKQEMFIYVDANTIRLPVDHSVMVLTIIL